MSIIPTTRVFRIGVAVGAGFLASASLSACSSGVASLEKRMLQELQDVRNLQADQTAQLTELQTEFRQLAGRLDDAEHVLRGRTTKLEEQLERFGSRVPPPRGVSDELLSRDERAIANVRAESARPYARALSLIRSGDFTAAKSLFQAFSEQHTATAFTDNSLYWLGVCEEQLGHSDQAIVSLSEVFQRFPAEDFAPHAVLRLGQVFDGMGQETDARAAFQKVIDDYPKSSAAREAQRLLKQRSSGRRR